MPNPPASAAERPTVVHFVTGGFSGATQVAVDLCLAALQAGPYAPVLVLRRKRHTPMARVEALPEAQRTVMLLVAVEEYTYAEAADILGVPVGTVMSRLHRGREALRQRLAPSPVGAQIVTLARVKR